MIGTPILPTNNRLDSEDTTSVWTPGPFNGIDVEGIRSGRVDGIIHETYFNNGFKPSTNINAAEAYWEDGWMAFGSDGGAIAAVAGVGLAGGIKLSSDGDDEGVVLRKQIAPFKLSRANKRFGYEIDLQCSTITDTKNSVFVGLMEDVAATAIIPITASHALADKNLVGFARLAGDGDKFDCVYKANGVTAVDVLADAVTIVAATRLRLGISYTPFSDFDESGRYWLRFWKNGRPIAEAVKQIPSTDGDDFPNDIGLGLVIAVLNATASTPGDNTFHRVRAVQEL